MAANGSDPRRQKTARKPQLPNWQPWENLACAKACVEASQTSGQTTRVKLEDAAREAYGRHFEIIAKDPLAGGMPPEFHVEWENKQSGYWTLVTSRLARMESGNLWSHFNDTNGIRAWCWNSALPAWEKVLNKGVSGKNMCDLRKMLLEELWLAECEEKARKKSAKTHAGGPAEPVEAGVNAIVVDQAPVLSPSSSSSSVPPPSL